MSGTENKNKNNLQTLLNYPVKTKIKYLYVIDSNKTKLITENKKNNDLQSILLLPKIQRK